MADTAASQATAQSDRSDEQLTIQIKGVSKSFGANRAVQGLTFEVRQGEVVGFLGPNGVGQDHHHEASHLLLHS